MAPSASRNGVMMTLVGNRVPSLRTKVHARVSRPSRSVPRLTNAGGPHADARFGGDTGGLEQIRQLAHRACGTGGTLGLGALSEAAGNLERLLDTFPANVAPDETQRARIAAGIDALVAQLERP